jgi:hypothetical protein
MRNTTHSSINPLAQNRYFNRRHVETSAPPSPNVARMAAPVGPADVIITDGCDHWVIRKSVPIIYDFEGIRARIEERQAEAGHVVSPTPATIGSGAPMDAEAQERWLDWCLDCCWRL